MKFRLLVFLFLCSCQGIPKPGPHENSHYFTISINSIEKQFDNSKDIDLIRLQLGPADVYVSNFRPIEKQFLQKAIDKKKEVFLNLFQDDIIPYTGAEKKRKQCLISQSEESIDFFSGPDNQWAECSLNKLEQKRSVRIWKTCQKTLWQITIKYEQINKFTFQCS